jgi:predicted DNA-binding transcriptional regulator YafY
MAKQFTKTQRWLDLISYLVGRRLPVEVGELMERLPAYAAYDNPESARRTFERDKEELIAAGIPIETTAFHIHFGAEKREGYMLSSGEFFLPYLKLIGDASAPRVRPGKTQAGRLEIAPDDARDAMEALLRVLEQPDSPFAPPARSAYAKLALDLDAGVLEEAPVHIAQAPARGESVRSLHALSDALLERRRVGFRYRAVSADAESERSVDPYGLLSHGGRWYLVGHDHGRGGIRQFRVDRMRDVAAQGAPDAFRPPADFRLRDYAHRQAWELGTRTELEARVRFRFPWSLWAERNGVGELERSEADGAAVRCFQVRAAEPFVRWLLALEADAEVLGPPELVETLRETAAAVAALYAEGGDDEAA